MSKHEEEVLIDLNTARERKAEYTEYLLSVVSEEIVSLCKQIALNSKIGGLPNAGLALGCLKKVAKRFAKATGMPIFSKTWNLLTSAMHGDVIEVYKSEINPILKNTNTTKFSKGRIDSMTEDRVVYSDDPDGLKNKKGMKIADIILEKQKDGYEIKVCKTCGNRFSTPYKFVNCLDCRRFFNKKYIKGRDEL